jgi:hypothetical protein
MDFQSTLLKKSDALVGRVATFHILQTSELAIFFRNPPQILETSKSENNALNKQEIPCTTETRSTFFGCRAQIQDSWTFSSSA